MFEEINMKVIENRINYDALGDLTSSITGLGEILSIVCGEYIGSGAFRDVYEYSLDPKYVVKVINATSTPEANINEFQLYNEIRGLCGPLEWVKDWFAPIKWISQGGYVLLQRKTKPNHKKLHRPDKIPSFLYDIKLDNFGWIGDKFVCHDYGILYGFIEYRKRFKKADWS